jgi:hypothetical protein
MVMVVPATAISLAVHSSSFNPPKLSTLHTPLYYIRTKIHTYTQNLIETNEKPQQKIEARGGIKREARLTNAVT